MSNAIESQRDTSTTSRKGRKPINGRAMTAAERKRMQREREKERKVDPSSLPSWLRIRHRLWRLLQDEFQLSNADEMVNALEALACVVAFVNCVVADNKVSDGGMGRYIHVIQAYLDPEKHFDSSNPIHSILHDLRGYQFAEDRFPGRKDNLLFDLFCDMLGESRNRMRVEHDD